MKYLIVQGNMTIFANLNFEYPAPSPYSNKNSKFSFVKMDILDYAYYSSNNVAYQITYMP